MLPGQSNTGYEAPMPSVICWLLLFPKRTFFNWAKALKDSEIQTISVIIFFIAGAKVMIFLIKFASQIPYN
jgi:hypothetical protein